MPGNPLDFEPHYLASLPDPNARVRSMKFGRDAYAPGAVEDADERDVRHAMLEDE